MMISSYLTNALSCCGPHMILFFTLATGSSYRTPIAGGCKARPRHWLAHVFTNHHQELFAFQSQFPLGLDGLVPSSQLAASSHGPRYDIIVRPRYDINVQHGQNLGPWDVSVATKKGVVKRVATKWRRHN